MGEDRRQGDRRQSSTEDRRGSGVSFQQDRRGAGTNGSANKLAAKTISLQTFIIIIAVVVIVIIGIVWFVANRTSDYEEYTDDEVVYEDEDYSTDDVEEDDDDISDELIENTTVNEVAQ